MVHATDFVTGFQEVCHGTFVGVGRTQRRCGVLLRRLSCLRPQWLSMAEVAVIRAGTCLGMVWGVRAVPPGRPLLGLCGRPVRVRHGAGVAQNPYVPPESQAVVCTSCAGAKPCRRVCSVMVRESQNQCR